MNERQPVFNALNGAELRKYILSRIEQQLDKSNEFPDGLTFPWVKWTVTILSYPQHNPIDEPKFRFTDEVGVPPEEEDKKSVISINFDEIIDTPDKARVDSDQPIPTIYAGPGLGPQKGSVLVDKPMVVSIPKIERKK